jgi:hypothetical protein
VTYSEWGFFTVQVREFFPWRTMQRRLSKHHSARLIAAVVKSTAVNVQIIEKVEDEVWEC